MLNKYKSQVKELTMAKVGTIKAMKICEVVLDYN